ncbi:major facilitator superfamily transporter [Colletotrichum karsti]|uniref:Major facilitator superfamily transporter n=1 Tax=Colletotrichum karsti TaxID=1095194 RepID=A0A9P6I8P5_9PEZI|nr:major facilitator superfamily transporter [Colletotrichum karsti]KAF9878000.1 major facilitator superfamily transporter [Colletotrichum karsti]
MADIKPSEDLVNDRDLLGDKPTDTSHVAELTEAEKAIEKKLVRRIDWLIMPLILSVYLLNWIDRNNYASARLAGLEEDLNLSLTEYQTGLSILFVGYILGQIPSNLLLNWFGRPSLYLGIFTIAWGLVSALTALVQNFAGIVVCRFILGFVEAPFFPGVLFYLSKWYSKKEMNLRMSIFYSGALVAGAFVTVVAGIIVCVFLPDFPQTWKALTPEMQHVANRRLALEAAEADTDEEGISSQLKGLKLCITDVKVWIFAFIYMGLTGAQGFGYYFPTLTRTLGYSQFISLLLVAPPHVFITIWSYIHGIISDRFTTRYWFCLYPAVVSIVGFSVFMTTNVFGPKYMTFFFMMFLMNINGTLFSWIAGVVSRPPAKRAAAYALINSLGNSVSIWTPYTYLDKESPYFFTGIGICVGLITSAAALMTLLRLILIRENKRLARLENENVQLTQKELSRLEKTAQVEGVSITAARALQKGFRYTI